MRDRELRRRLLQWIAEDDDAARRLAGDGSLFEGYHPEMEAVHRKNAARLAAVVEARGWPGRTLVGADGAAAAWRIAQHAIGEPALVRAWLPLMQRAAERGEVEPAHVAMLDDRVRVFEGRPQRYGTQYDWSEDGSGMVPMVGVEDPERLEERRRLVGLPPMEWRRPPPTEEPPPRDVAARARQMDDWARRVGWRLSKSLPIETAALILRPFTTTDARKVLAMSHERGMREWLPDQVYEDEREASSVLRYLIAQYDNPAAPAEAPLVLGVCLRSSGELIGHVGLSPAENVVEIGYAIEDAHQGKGFATEAVRSMADWGLRTFALPGVDGIVATDNAGSCKVLEKAGFVLLEEATRALHGVTRLVRTYRKHA